MITSEQIRMARALLRWEQRDLAHASRVSLPAIKRLETIPGELAAQRRTVEALRAALEAAGIEFTNGGRPGVRPTSVWMLHRVADRASLTDYIEKNLGSGPATAKPTARWRIEKTVSGLACWNAENELVGEILAGRDGHPEPQVSPSISDLRHNDCLTPNDLYEWLNRALALENSGGSEICRSKVLRGSEGTDALHE